MKIAGVILVFLLAFAVGCGPTIMQGTRIDASKRNEVIKGQTNVERITTLFGKPDKIEKLPSGEEKYVYQYYKEEYTHWWTLPRFERQKLEIFVKDGLVQDYHYTREARDVVTDEDK